MLAAHRLLRSVSLESLLGFEAAARLGSFTAAADELSLTQSAVSKQIKTLEDALGVTLMHRGGRALRLTLAGQQLTLSLGGTLQGLSAALVQAAGAQAHRLAITCPPALAALWLSPRLHQWPDQSLWPELVVDASEACLPLSRSGMDLAIRLAPLGQPPEGGSLLMQERLQLVCAPDKIAQLTSVEALLGQPLLEFAHPAAAFHQMGWAHWLGHLRASGQPQGAAQAATGRTPRVIRFSQYDHLIQAAKSGLGVAIGRRPLVDDDIARGALAVLWPEHTLSGGAYFTLVSSGARERPQVMDVVTWLQAQAQAQIVPN